MVGDHACSSEVEVVVVGEQRNGLEEVVVVVADHVGHVAAWDDSTHEGLEGDRAGEDGERPCRVEVLEKRDEKRYGEEAVEEVEAWY